MNIEPDFEEKNYGKNYFTIYPNQNVMFHPSKNTKIFNSFLSSMGVSLNSCLIYTFFNKGIIYREVINCKLHATSSLKLELYIKQGWQSMSSEALSYFKKDRWKWKSNLIRGWDGHTDGHL